MSFRVGNQFFISSLERNLIIVKEAKNFHDFHYLLNLQLEEDL